MLTALKEPLLILISLSSIKPDQTAGSETIKMILLFHLRMMLARHSLSHQTGSVGPVNQILTHNKLVADRSFYPGANFPAFSPFPDIIFYTNNEFHQEQLVGPLLITKNSEN